MESSDSLYRYLYGEVESSFDRELRYWEGLYSKRANNVKLLVQGLFIVIAIGLGYYLESKGIKDAFVFFIVLLIGFGGAAGGISIGLHNFLLEVFSEVARVERKMIALFKKDRLLLLNELSSKKEDIEFLRQFKMKSKHIAPKYCLVYDGSKLTLEDRTKFR